MSERKEHERERSSPTMRELMENDRAALGVLLRLAEYGADAASRDKQTAEEREIVSCYENGAGGMEPDAVTAWVRDMIQRTDNTIDALDGAGPPVVRAVVEVTGGVAEVTECPAGFEVEIIDHDNLEAERANGEHDPKWCGCEYRGNNAWSCGHIDGEATEPEPVAGRTFYDVEVRLFVRVPEDKAREVNPEDHEDGAIHHALDTIAADLDNVTRETRVEMVEYEAE